jgi:tetratricopeptide (TPR) repeat protein
MGLFSFLKRQPKAPPEQSSEELRKQLFELILKDHLAEFEHLCGQNEEVIVDSFPQWRKVPVELRSDRKAIEQYSHCLMVLATYFQKQLKRDELMAALTGIDGSNPVQEWQSALQQAWQLMEDLNYQEAIEILQTWRQRAGDLQGTAVDSLLPVTLGNLAECFFQTGRAELAIEPAEQALSIVADQGSPEGEINCLGNLYEIHRYAGNWQQAAGYAGQIAQIFYDQGDLISASHWRQQARATESIAVPVRVLVKLGEEYFETNEIPRIDVPQAEFAFVRNRRELRPSAELFEQAQLLAAQGNADEALSLLDKAAHADQYNPAPYQLAGEIHMALGRWRQAAERFEKLHAICPGWQGCGSQLWMSRQLASGALGQDAYEMLANMSDQSMSSESKVHSLGRLLQQYPRLAEAHYLQGHLLAQSGRVAEAEAVLRHGLEVVEDPDVETRILLDLAMIVDRVDEKAALFERATRVANGNLLAQAMASFALRQLTGEDLV